MFALRRIGVQSSSRGVAALLRRGNAGLQTDGVTASDVVPPPPPAAPAKAEAAAAPSPAPENPKNVATKAAAPAKDVSNASDPDPEAQTTQGRRRRKKTFTLPQRPSISAAKPKKWNRPIAEGVLPAYDLALKVIRTDSIRLQEEAEGLRKEIGEMESKVEELGGWGSDGAREVEERLEKTRARLGILEVQAGVNLPEVRWRVANAMADMSQPVHRHLMEQRWRSEGGLDLLMERIHQMKVVPDVLPDLRPAIDVHLTARTTYRQAKETSKRHIAVEPGTYLLPEQTIEPPHLYANVFHTDTRLYTMLLVDPDVPDEERQSFRTFLHWMKPNIPLSATHQTRIADLNDHTPYIPPHPQRGTPYHRYVLLLLPQPPLAASSYTRNAEARAMPGVSTSVALEIPAVAAEDRRDFDVRAFAQRWGLDGAKGGGAHIWREVWDEKVSRIYRAILKEPEPRFGRPPKADPYAAYKVSKRYV
ncbi:54S ribosomal protein L35, mitochondrial [Hypsizygus marmoreus]|uniref:54S ribosomal protein L35, mitochondrial n=1 Tax=Hypsizygus marmoreus TaxID=39966 RepID=A0A369K6H0_HYPMA|nr:54S ribosomal protein L35, mitochondrial [Hypsizygus marmoreus]